MTAPYSRGLLRAALAEAGLPADTEVVADAPILWDGWECDSHACLVRAPDGPRVLILAGVSGEDPELLLAARLLAYDEAAVRTRALLDALRRLRGDPGPR